MAQHFSLLSPLLVHSLTQPSLASLRKGRFCDPPIPIIKHFHHAKGTRKQLNQIGKVFRFAGLSCHVPACYNLCFSRLTQQREGTVIFLYLLSTRTFMYIK